MRLQGKVAIVTGGASGFGAGIARNGTVRVNLLEAGRANL